MSPRCVFLFSEEEEDRLTLSILSIQCDRTCSLNLILAFELVFSSVVSYSTTSVS